MAIEIEWQVRPPRLDDGEHRPTLFPRTVNSETIDEYKLAEKIAARGLMSRGIAQGAIEELADVLAELLREGKEVSLNALGTFRLAVGSDGPIYQESRGSMHDITVRGINFKPSKALMHAIGKPTFRLAPRTTAIVATPASEMGTVLGTYFQSHESITSQEFARLFHLKRSTAFTRLSALMEAGVLRKEGGGRQTRYVRG